MALYLLIFSIIVVTCVFLNKFSGKIGIPVLLRRISFHNNGFDLLLFISIALLSYALPDLVGGNTLLEAGDEVVICTRSYQDESTDRLIRHPLSENSRWAGHKVSEYPKSDNSLLVMIKRGDDRIIPNGNTILRNGDVLVLLKRNS